MTESALSRRAFVGGAVAGFAALGARSVGAAPVGTSTALHQPLELSTPLSVADVETPALLIDLDALDHNLAKMARHFEGKRVALRPHVKTHKCPVLAKRQIELGAIGVCAAKLSEAEVMVEAGIDNVLITSPVVTPTKIRRVVALAGKTPGL